ncbi:hypothetical protein FOMG_16897 [Fusarium oxysporum f. sp. melonis 26406]|uniref:Uncharacterized protein n=1 Tax=Fusarium oxysporum f. sp. melonis 26406 TaxID=1089452 RepID=W9ZD62_FUSOX|nr:hypothetical protein FOMG_16897 [Fusarium oxysporum f. sp. melonis 26406]
MTLLQSMSLVVRRDRDFGLGMSLRLHRNMNGSVIKILLLARLAKGCGLGRYRRSKNLYPQPAATERKYGNPGMAVSNARYFFIPLENIGTSGIT